MRKLLALNLMLLCFQFSLSQSPANVSGCSIWIKHNKEISENHGKKKLDSLNYNYSPIFSKKEKSVISKSKLKSNFTLFIVYKSNSENEEEILKYKVGSNEFKITNKNTYSTMGMEYSKFSSEKGVLLEYSANLNKNKNSNICLLSFGEHVNTEYAPINNKDYTSVYEFIFYPRILSETEKLKVESYLSIKYGISLIGKKNYLDSENNKIWNVEKNQEFNNNVTGIGKDEKSDLFQKRSINNLREGILIGYGKFDSINYINNRGLADKTFILWGDNNKSKAFKKLKDKNPSDSIVKMDCQWKTQLTSLNNNSLTSHVVVDPKVLFNGYVLKNKKPDVNFWLVLSKNSSQTLDYFDAEYIPSKIIKDNKLLFDNINWDFNKSGDDMFSFVEAPEFFVSYDVVSQNCDLSENGKIKYHVVGGQSPFQLKIEHDGKTINLEKNTREFDIETPTNGIYKISIKDNRDKSYTQTIQIDTFDKLEGVLNPLWYLNSENEVEIIPFLNSDSSSNYTFSWIEKDKIIANSRTLKLKNEGDYSLKISNNFGCEKIFPFSVIEKSVTDPKVTLYPNPSKAGNAFNIDFDLYDESKAEIRIYSLNGALIKSEEIENIGKHYNFSDTLNTSGAYLIVITTNTNSTTYKLIVD